MRASTRRDLFGREEADPEAEDSSIGSGGLAIRHPAIPSMTSAALLVRSSSDVNWAPMRLEAWAPDDHLIVVNEGTRLEGNLKCADDVLVLDNSWSVVPTQ
jgi:hypothetical protein